MNGVIECACVGEVASEIKAGVSAGGKCWSSFTLRVGSGEAAEWPRVSIFGDVAVALEGKLAKGRKLYIEGTIRLNVWQAADGAPRSGLSIAAKRCDIVGAIGRQRADKGDSARVAAEAAFAPTSAGGKAQPEFDDQLPF